jgi:predicted nuclease of restriction endonuclease-like RecB superfamily
MTDMNTLFSRDPLSLTDTDIDSIIEEMRKRRHLFNAGGATATKPAAKATAAQTATKSLKIELEL